MIRTSNYKLILMLATISCLFGIIGCEEENELPSTIISFQAESKTVAENDPNGALIPIDFSQISQAEGSFIVTVASNYGKYGEEYVTEPATSGGKINYTIPIGGKENSVKVIPIDDHEKDLEEDIIVTLELFAGKNSEIEGISKATVVITEND